MESIDEIDLTILRQLQKNSKITAKELAQILNITISPVYERIKRLEQLGYIKEYVAILDKVLLHKRAFAAPKQRLIYDLALAENVLKTVRRKRTGQTPPNIDRLEKLFQRLKPLAARVL